MYVRPLSLYPTDQKLDHTLHMRNATSRPFTTPRGWLGRYCKLGVCELPHCFSPTLSAKQASPRISHGGGCCEVGPRLSRMRMHVFAIEQYTMCFSRSFFQASCNNRQIRWIEAKE